jgi:hydrogenase nickel incorporation protein HypA/HybF
MHEMAFATNLYEQVMGIVQSQGPLTVKKIELEVGALQLVAPEAFEMAWEAVRADTPLAEAALHITEIKSSARCRHCERVFEPAIDNYLCPNCGQADAELLAGNDIILKSLVCEKEDST